MEMRILKKLSLGCCMELDFLRSMKTRNGVWLTKRPEYGRKSNLTLFKLIFLISIILIINRLILRSISETTQAVKNQSNKFHLKRNSLSNAYLEKESLNNQLIFSQNWNHLINFSQLSILYRRPFWTSLSQKTLIDFFYNKAQIVFLECSLLSSFFNL